MMSISVAVESRNICLALLRAREELLGSQSAAPKGKTVPFGHCRLAHVISSESLPAPIPSEASGRVSLFLLIKHSS